VIGCRGHVSTLSGHINYNNYCNAFDKRNMALAMASYSILGEIERDS